MNEQPKTYDHLNFPEGLTPKDIELITKQSELQDATLDHEVLGFAEAYKQAKEFSSIPENFTSISKEKIESLIMQWATLAETRNEKGFRTTEVTFSNGSKALEASKIPHAMENLISYLNDILKNGFAEQPEGDPRPPLGPNDLYREFEEIHPFEDGNGRIGDLLWKIAVTRQTGTWPETLPPDFFGEGR